MAAGRIDAGLGVRRETASGYLRAAGVPIRGERRRRLVAKPASGAEVSTDPGAANPASATEVSTDSAGADAAGHRVRAVPGGDRDGAGPGRNAIAIYPDLVDDHGFPGRYASVRRFVRGLRGAAVTVARAVITTAPGEEAQVYFGDAVVVRSR